MHPHTIDEPGTDRFVRMPRSWLLILRDYWRDRETLKFAECVTAFSVRLAMVPILFPFSSFVCYVLRVFQLSNCIRSAIRNPLPCARGKQCWNMKFVPCGSHC